MTENQKKLRFKLLLPEDKAIIAQNIIIYKKMAISKLLLQLDLTEERINTEFEHEINKTKHAHKPDDNRDLLVLDLETYYTVTHDLLKLICLLIPDKLKKAFKKEKGYKIICAIRSHLIRHAYDKNDGDPYCGFGWAKNCGPMLKGGSPFSFFEDEGFFHNRQLLKQLIYKYQIELLCLPDPNGRFKKKH